MEDQLSEALEPVAEDASRKLMESIREEYLREVERAEQGADGLAPFVSEVRQRRGESGRFASGFEFEVDHPFAHLHERGGHIEPTYATAQAKGYERGDMYNALTDCNEWVHRKSLLRNAIRRVRRREADD